MPESQLGFRGNLPRELVFGTSGLRGLVTDITDLEAYVNTRGFLECLLESEPDVARTVAIAGDLRPSTDGEAHSILKAVAQGCSDAGFDIVNAGKLPTPALAYFAFEQRIPSIMVTGSHIPFDRNGIKFNLPTREVLKSDEGQILQAVARVRAREYRRARALSLFDDTGRFLPSVRSTLPQADGRAQRMYRERYLEFFPQAALADLSIAVYQHSAVGRDLIPEVLTALGARVFPIGRSEQFIPIDTEAISAERLIELEALHRKVLADFGTVDAIISTDGDSDRPLVLGVERDGRLRFINGDWLGMLVADYLSADALAVPVSASDAIEGFFEGRAELARTRIGSPWVIASMQRLSGSRRVGWEANGGFLVGSHIQREGRCLKALPTRDALLPILCVLHAAKLGGQRLSELPDRLPPRFSDAGLVDVEEPAGSLLEAYLQAHFAPISEVEYATAETRWLDAAGVWQVCTSEQAAQLDQVRLKLLRQLSTKRGFDRLQRINFVDGVRCYFANGDVAHIRASGNAPQVRMYALANTPERAARIVAEAVQSGGVLEGIVKDAERAAFVEAISRNIEHTAWLFAKGRPAACIGTVSGSIAAQRFWQQTLDRMKPAFRAQLAVSLHEDLPTNQALGLLLMWQRLRERLVLGEGALVAFVFGEGSRATPFTEAECGQKPAITSFVKHSGADNAGFQPMVGLALSCFAPVEAFLRRSGFEGVVVKWGDEVQIPARDLSGSDPLFKQADIVRFVSLRTMTEEDAKSKDWVGVNAAGSVTAFIPRRPLAEMRKLSQAGLLQTKGEHLVGGINLGSIAASRSLLDELLDEFSSEIVDATAERNQRPDLDPQFFTVFMFALLDDPLERERCYREGVSEVPALARLSQTFPDLLARLRDVVERFAGKHGRKPKVVAMDFGDQYWGDIGQHQQIYSFYMALNQDSADGRVARALAGLHQARDANGNLMTAATKVSSGIEVRNSVLIDCELSGSGTVEDCVLVGSRVHDIVARQAFDILSCVRQLTLEARAGCYKVISREAVVARPGERVTSLFLPGGSQELLRVHEDMDLRDRAATYEARVLGNPLSFAEAHSAMSEMSAEQLAASREKQVEVVLAALRIRG